MGIKADLAQLSKPELPSDEEILYRHDIGDWTDFVLTAPMSATHLNVHRWYFPHPRYTWPYPPEWTKGPGFSIPTLDAGHWRDGIEKIMGTSGPRVKGWNNVTQFEIRYGNWRVRFFVQDKQGRVYCQAQAYLERNGKWIPTRKCVYWPHDDPRLGNELVKGLDRLTLLRLEGVTPALDMEVIESEAEFG